MYKSKEGECIKCGYVWLCQQMLRGFNKPHTCNGPYKYKL